MANEAENLDIEITEEKIEKAAVPEKKRVEEEVSDENVEISLDDSKQDVAPVTEDQVQENFEVSPQVEEQAKDMSEVEKRATLAQNRINKAVAQAKEFQRRELMAVQYAKELKEQNEQLRQQQKTQMSSYGDEFGNRVESQMTLAKQALKQATESGDAEAIATATEALTLATADKSRLEQYRQAQKQYEEQEAAYAQNLQNQPQDQQNTQPLEEYAEPSPKAREWAQKNTWFGQDQVATSVAFAVHKQLDICRAPAGALQISHGTQTLMSIMMKLTNECDKSCLTSLTWKQTKDPSKLSLRQHALHRLDANKIIVFN